MGYETEFNLTVRSDNFLIIPTLLEFSESAKFGIDENGDSKQAIKWYRHEEDMRKLSTMYPDVVFELTGVGEEYPDIWKKYFMNGKMQKVKGEITFDEFYPEELS